MGKINNIKENKKTGQVTKITILLLLSVLLCFFPTVIGTETTTEDLTFNLGEHPQNSTIDISITCINSSTTNITRLILPDGSFSINSITPMTKNNNNYNYSYNSTSQLGRYSLVAECDENGALKEVNKIFYVIPNGRELKTYELVVYILGLIILLFALLLFGYLAVTTPFKNPKKQHYYDVLKQYRAFKLFCIGITYILVLMILALSLYLSSFLYNPGLNTLIRYFYTVIIRWTYPVIILLAVFGFIYFIYDYLYISKIKKQIEGGRFFKDEPTA